MVHTKKKTVLLIVLASFLVLLIVVFVSLKTVQSWFKDEVLSSKSITTDYGDLFVLTTERDVGMPESNLIMNVDINGIREATVFIETFFSNYGLDYNFDRDFIQSPHRVLRQYQDEAVRIYEFHWGVVHSEDEGKTFDVIDKSFYEECYFKEDGKFKQIYDLVNPNNVFVSNTKP